MTIRLVLGAADLAGFAPLLELMVGYTQQLLNALRILLAKDIVVHQSHPAQYDVCSGVVATSRERHYSNMQPKVSPPPLAVITNPKLATCIAQNFIMLGSNPRRRRNGPGVSACS